VDRDISLALLKHKIDHGKTNCVEQFSTVPGYHCLLAPAMSSSSAAIEGDNLDLPILLSTVLVRMKYCTPRLLVGCLEGEYCSRKVYHRLCPLVSLARVRSKERKENYDQQFLF
jgi:hypothetical protein